MHIAVTIEEKVFKNGENYFMISKLSFCHKLFGPDLKLANIYAN